MKRTILAVATMLSPEMKELEEAFEVLRLWEARDPEYLLRERCHDIVGILSTYNCSGVSDRLITALPNLEIIAQYGAGYDNIDLKAAHSRGVVLVNTPDVVTDDTADTAFSLLLCLARRIVEADMFVRVGRWHSGAFPLGVALSGKTIGIVGLGKIGSAIARRAEAFGLTVEYFGRTKKNVPYQYCKDLLSLAQRSDFLVLSCSGGADTKHIVDYKVLQALGRKGYLVNIARGSVVKEDDLLIALRNGDIAGAGLDVYEDEPNVSEEMIKMDNVVLLPHIGGGTLETRSEMGRLVIQNFLAYFNGQPLLTPVKVPA